MTGEEEGRERSEKGKLKKKENMSAEYHRKGRTVIRKGKESRGKYDERKWVRLRSQKRGGM